jgi:hypothetical protein
MIGRPLLASFTVLLAACSEPGSPPADDRCPPSYAAADPVADADAVALLFYGESGFEVVTEGQTLPMVQGLQGGYMVTPLVRVEQASFGTDGRCVVMDIEASVATGAHGQLHYEFLEPRPDGGYWLTDTIPLLLSFDASGLDGERCTITATWRDDDRVASASVEVELDLELH